MRTAISRFITLLKKTTLFVMFPRFSLLGRWRRAYRTAVIASTATAVRVNRPRPPIPVNRTPIVKARYSSWWRAFFLLITYRITD